MSFQFPRLIVDSAQKIAFITLLWITALFCTFVIIVIEIYNKSISAWYCGARKIAMLC